ncbi:hypothetical protein [uncultured Gulosibacter sp.]|uniref:hypothetical protein n=1 Tax=uncultured Gulosibacter sp. TaxID=1339167 RepID=UPI00288C2EF9|nr:hypothetical protein [uncultured Gulosibacter sp.]
MSFATVEQLQLRMNTTFDNDSVPQVEALLEDATQAIRADIGQHVAPRQTATFSDWPDSEGRVYLPQTPVVDVSAVTAKDMPVAFTLRDNYVTVPVTEKVTVTFTYGFAEVPRDLEHWTCVLTATALANLDLGVGLAPGGLSSVAIDDFRASWADGGDKAGMTLPERVAQQLREQYGGGTAVVTTR